MAKATLEQVAMAAIALDLGRLLRMAEAHRLGLLAYLIDMALQEAASGVVEEDKPFIEVYGAKCRSSGTQDAGA